MLCASAARIGVVLELGGVPFGLADTERPKEATGAAKPNEHYSSYNTNG